MEGRDRGRGLEESRRKEGKEQFQRGNWSLEDNQDNGDEKHYLTTTCPQVITPQNLKD